MLCPSCGKANPEEARFCGTCGAPLRRTAPCPHCAPGEEHSAGAELDRALCIVDAVGIRSYAPYIPLELAHVARVTSLALTKLDGTARGGAVLAIARELELPVSVVGVGEGIDDWDAFDPGQFARGLF